VCLERFGTLRPMGTTPVIRSDNGLIYQSRRFRAACRDYRLAQEFITPYPPEQDGIIERFLRSVKEECTTSSASSTPKRELTAWIRWYVDARPHQALGYRCPREFRAQEATQVA